MTKNKDSELETNKPQDASDFTEKKLAIEKRQKRVLSELGKTVSELKNGLYKLDRLPED